MIISGGGTGGHIYPAIAIANAFKSRFPESEILFVGAEGKMEMEKVPQAGYPIEGLWISGLQRKLTLDNLSFPFKVISSLIRSKKIIKRVKPHVVIGVGGYASGPLLRVASKKGIPALLQEQNSYAGLTNKILANRVKRICVAYPNMDRFFPAEKVRLTGNPVRKDITAISGKRQEAIEHFGFTSETPVLMILGGSLGARTLNDSVLLGLQVLIDSGIQVIWQCGQFYYDEMRSKLDATSNQDRIKLFQFLKEMDLAYAAADVVISRAGALSVSELSVAGKPTLFVPSPNVAEDHQTKNAQAMVDQNAAILVRDKDARKELISQALALLENSDRKAELSKNILALAKPHAAEAIVDEIIALVE
jgi:UDP-N-acetylglucosamine--N-acetylmuramyl-(pentapeptide) pyrophosphoryl-undecaprenol N-acetylglucosamine transferase